MTRLHHGVLFCAAIAIGAITGCYGDGAPIVEGDTTVLPDAINPGDTVTVTDPPEDSCVSTVQFFQKKVWGPTLSSKCMACHNTQGAASNTKLILQAANITGYLLHNYEAVRNVAAYEYEGQSILLAKPTMSMPHAGGAIVDLEGAEYQNLLQLVKEFKDPVICASNEDNGAFFNNISMLGPIETFRKAAHVVAGRAPTIDEETYIAVGGEKAMLESLDALLHEEAFYGWVKEVYNDKFLTDKYVPGNEAADLYNMDAYPDIRWYDQMDMDMPVVYDVSAYFMQQGMVHTNRALAQEPLELIVHVVRNDLPFTEVLTADYTVVNPYSAMSLGVTGSVVFEDPVDPYEFKPAQVEGLPHAGVLTSAMWLNRFPTTATNRNRHRSRMVADFFMATDVMKLAERPIDPTSIEDHNPTMFNPNCNVCHNNIDPIAGCFQNWDDQGRYMPPEEGWHSDMLPAGLGEDSIPYEERYSALQWLGQKLSKDPRFATAAVRAVYEGLTGQSVLGLPGYDEEVENDLQVDPAIFDAQMLAYETQLNKLDSMSQDFAEAGFNFRGLVKALVLSPYFRANGTDFEPDAIRSEEIAHLGTARFATPGSLHRKIEAVVGFPWRAGPGGQDYLLSTAQYRIFFGGIDSDSVTKRITDPNGFMVSVGDRMANEMACASVARDFAMNQIDRSLFPFVEASYMPEDENGFPVPAALEAIKENIRYLHWRLLGERLIRSSVDVTNTYNLFLATLKEGREGLEAGILTPNLPGACRATTDWWTGLELPDGQEIINDDQYIIRSWMAVLTYMFSDYKFLYE